VVSKPDVGALAAAETTVVGRTGEVEVWFETTAMSGP
jgi:hypothetical protein